MNEKFGTSTKTIKTKDVKLECIINIFGGYKIANTICNSKLTNQLNYMLTWKFVMVPGNHKTTYSYIMSILDVGGMT